MNDEDKAEQSELRENWTEHAYTRSWGVKFRAEADKALANLKACAASSTDPKVTAAFVEWREKAVMAHWLETGGKK